MVLFTVKSPLDRALGAWIESGIVMPGPDHWPTLVAACLIRTIVHIDQKGKRLSCDQLYADQGLCYGQRSLRAAPETHHGTPLTVQVPDEVILPDYGF